MKQLLKKQQESQEMRFSNESLLSISDMLKVRGGDEDPPIIKIKP
jgi:hypothetical protein